MRQAGAAARKRQSDTVREHRLTRIRHGAPGSGRTIRTTTIPSSRVTRPVDASEPVTRMRRRPPSRLVGIRTDYLTHILIAGDAVAVLFGFYLVLFSVSSIGPSSWKELLAQLIAVTTVGMVAIRSQRLWVARLNSVRAIELSRLTRAVGLMGLGTIVLDRGLHLYFHVSDIAVACVVAWPVLVAWRSIYRTWVGAQRKAGRSHAASDRRRHRSPGDGADRHLRHPPRAGHPRRRCARLGARGPRRRSPRAVAGQLRRRPRRPRPDSRRERRALLERHQSGAARRAVPRGAGRGTAT